jgi:hypothetical protein
VEDANHNRLAIEQYAINGPPDGEQAKKCGQSAEYGQTPPLKHAETLGELADPMMRGS